MYTQPNFSLHLEISIKPMSLQFSGLVFPYDADLCDVSGLMIMVFCFLVLCALESFNRLKVSAIKVLLEQNVFMVRNHLSVSSSRT